MNKLNLAVFTAMAAVGLTGCQNTVNSVENADKNAIVQNVNDKRVVTDRFLRDRLAVTGVNVATNSNGLMQAQVAMVNTRTGFFSQIWSGMTGENPYNVNYRFRWMDENGMAQSGPTSTWQQKIIIPGETVYFQSVAPSSYCKDFMLDIKEAE